MTSAAFRLAFLCPFCGKVRQRVLVGTDDATGALVVDHPWPDDCDTWRHYSATPRTRLTFVRMAVHQTMGDLA